MPKKNINYLFVGISVFFFYNYYQKMLIEKEKSLQEGILNASESNIMNYQAKYFKDSEYFGIQPVPSNYYKNWKLLSILLDKIRMAYGNPVYIVKGYKMPINNIIEDMYSVCRAVMIFGTRDTYDLLKSATSTVIASGLNQVTKVNYHDDSDTIEIIM